MKHPEVRYKRHRFVAAHDARAGKEPASEDRMLDEALAETFPASDPLALTMPHGSSSRSDDPSTKH